MEEYTGFKDIVPTDEQLKYLFAKDCPNIFGCLLNEYLIARDEDGNVVQTMRCDGDFMTEVPYQTIHSEYLGDVKPRNVHQKLAINLLYSPKTTIKILAGCFGSGKDYLMCSAAMELMEKDKYEKIVYVRNNVEVRNSRPIGFLPGSSDDKLLPFAMPLADHVGGTEGLAHMISRGRIEVTHLGFIRGRDIRDSIILCSEAENMTKEHIQLLIGRVGERSQLWINGDMRQCDGDVFQKNSGLMTAVDRLKGHPRFGYVKLMKTERSETAAMADLLD